MIDTFTITHYSGPCRNVPFFPGPKSWFGRHKIRIIPEKIKEVALLVQVIAKEADK